VLVWSVNAAQNTLQRDSALHLVASRVNKRTSGTCPGETHCRMWTLIATLGVIDLGSFVDELLPKFWEEYVKNNEVPAATRKNALTAWLWVRTLVQRGFVIDF